MLKIWEANKFWISRNFVMAHVDDPTLAGGGGNDTIQGGGGNDTPKYNDKQVNDMIAKEKVKYTKTIQDQVKQLQQLQESQNLTAQEKDNLQSQINDLNNSLLTKDQQLAQEKERLTKDYDKKLHEVTEDRTRWKSNFENMLTDNSLMGAALSNGAVRESQVVAILRPLSRVADELGPDGKPTGKHVVKVKLPDKDDKGKPVVLDLSPEEAVKRMKERVDEFGNLFKSTIEGGFGGNNGARDRERPKVEDLKDLKTYREKRKQVLEGEIPIGNR